MFSRLVDNVINPFLKDFAIDARTTSIFEKALLKLSGADESLVDIRFEEFGVGRTGKDYALNVVRSSYIGVKFKNLASLMQYLELNADDYIFGEPLSISEKIMNEKIIPAFKKYVTELNVAERLQYQNDSLFESRENANQKIKLANIADEILLFLNERRNEASGINRELSKALLTLKGDMSTPFSGYIADTFADIKRMYGAGKHFANNPLIQEKLKTLLATYAAYDKFNRSPAVVAVKELFNDMHNFTAKWEITTHKCDLFEETLLKLAGIKTQPSTSLSGTAMHDASCFGFSFGGLTNEDAARFHAYLKAFDPHAKKEDRGCQNFHFEIYGPAFVGGIYPLFKAEVERLAKETPEVLKPYQERSAEDFAAQKAAGKKTPPILTGLFPDRCKSELHNGQVWNSPRLH